MFCPKCGKQIPDETKFCPFCGCQVVQFGSPPQKKKGPKNWKKIIVLEVVMLVVLLVAIAGVLLYPQLLRDLFGGGSTTISSNNSSRRSSAVSVWDGRIANSFASGAGTEKDPYEIRTADQLAFLAKQVNQGNSFANTYFELESDIHLNELLSFDGIMDKFFSPLSVMTEHDLPIDDEEYSSRLAKLVRSLLTDMTNDASYMAVVEECIRNNYAWINYIYPDDFSSSTYDRNSFIDTVERELREDNGSYLDGIPNEGYLPLFLLVEGFNEIYENDGGFLKYYFNAWVPIGSYTAPFMGHFNGNDHVIEGLLCFGGFDDSLYEYLDNSHTALTYGIFGATSGAEIKNLHIKNSYINIVGIDDPNMSYVLDNYEMGVGGLLVGLDIASDTETLIVNCSAEDGLILAWAPNIWAVGGLVGGVWDEAYISQCVIKDCFSDVGISIHSSGSDLYVGGIAGALYNTSMENAYSFGYCLCTGDIDNCCVGGLAGVIQNTTVTDCSNLSDGTVGGKYGRQFFVTVPNAGGYCSYGMFGSAKQSRITNCGYSKKYATDYIGWSDEWSKNLISTIVIPSAYDERLADTIGLKEALHDYLVGAVRTRLAQAAENVSG